MKTLTGNRLSLGASLLFLALVFCAFARQFYLATWFHMPSLAGLLRVHGVVMSGWVLLLVVQSGLISAHRVRYHRWLGMFGFGWAVLVVVLGSVTTLHASAREVREHSAFAPLQLTVTGLELVEMMLFAILVAGAVWWRRHGGIHGRLMLLTIITMLPSVFPRLPMDLFPNNGSILLAVDAVLLLLVGIDTLTHRRLHPAFGWGGATVALGLNLAFLGAYTPVWRDFLSGLLS